MQVNSGLMSTSGAIEGYGDSMAANARVVLSLLLLLGACTVTAIVVSLRAINVGTDTRVYAGVFLGMRDSLLVTRFEPGFLALTRAASATGMSVAGYQATLFAALLAGSAVAARRYWTYLDSNRSFLTFLTAVLLFLFVSPMFVNAAINAVRQGLAAPLVFAALLAFHQRKWRSFALLGAAASSLHYSSLVYLSVAPVLLLSLRRQRIIAGLAFLAYCSGLTMMAVRVAVPAVYSDVMNYHADAVYRAGIRYDFALFSLFWYLLPFIASRTIRSPFSERIKQSAAVYMAMVLPFFLVGWGNYSNRYLLPPWVAASFIVAAVFCFSRVPLLRHPLLLRGGLVFACGVFSFYVIHQVMI
ncbi:EpsG family protein [Rhodanobacter umsongensis]|uniref:EpsG family protein n=1 Tax=Rhodanobacter umsongensis TaxID=633153 RepID=A0ABW0JKG3_9GAMM